MPLLNRLGILQKVDVVVLAMFCVSYVEWRRAAEEVEKLKSLFIKQPSGRICKHPIIGIRDDAQENMRKIISELGMSPAARTGLYMAPNEKIVNEKLKFFKGA